MMVSEEGGTPALLARNLINALLARPSTGGAVSFTPKRVSRLKVRELADALGVTLTATVTPSLVSRRYMAHLSFPLRGWKQEKSHHEDPGMKEEGREERRGEVYPQMTQMYADKEIPLSSFILSLVSWCLCGDSLSFPVS
jgi:hypothetical protein